MAALFDTLFGGVSDLLGDGISSLLESILNATLFKIFYYLERALCQVINILYQLFEVFSGQTKVKYAGEPDYLINIFFNNKVISNVYWAMAGIGIALTFGFTIWAVIKKMFDISDREQRSLGQILTAAFRSIVIIIGLTVIMNVVIEGTNVLMQQVNFIFNNAEHLDEPDEKVFTDEEYAAMGRVLLTIGNYSLIKSSNNRYNLNSCYNAIRSDMYYLQERKVFVYDYYKVDENGNVVESWQSLLARIARSSDLSKELAVDQYNENVSEALTYVMDFLANNKYVSARDRIAKKYSSEEKFHLDRLVFLMGTLSAAKNPEYNVKPQHDDALRGPYYYEDGKSVYNLDNVKEDFDIGFKTDYILVWMMAVACIFDLVVIIMNCVARIFNMIFLYIIAPPIIAAAPLDQGGKFKQWTTAFLIQALSVFGTVIAMRLLDIYLPLVMDPDLVLFENSKYMNMFAKFIMVYAGFEVAKKATGLLTGILADSAGWQSIQAGDMSSSAGKAIGSAIGAGKAVAGAAIGTGKYVGGKALAVGAFAAKPLTNRIKRPFKELADKWSKLGTGGQQSRNEKAIKEKISSAKYQKQYLDAHPEDRQWLEGPQNANNNNNQNPNNNNQNPNNNNNNNLNPNNNNQNQNQNQNPNNNNGNNRNNNNFVAPPLPRRYQGDEGAGGGGAGAGSRNLRHRFGFDQPPGGGGPGAGAGVGGPGGRRAGQGPQQGGQGPQQGGQGPQQGGQGPQQGPPQGQQPQRRRAGSFSQRSMRNL